LASLLIIVLQLSMLLNKQEAFNLVLNNRVFKTQSLNTNT